MTSACSVRHRLAALAAGLALVLGACGDSSSVTSGTPSTDGAVTTSTGPDASNLREPKPAGEDWTLAASGTDTGVTWHVYTTPATDDGACYAIELEPPPTADFFDVVDESDVYKDRRMSGCVVTPGSTTRRTPGEVTGGSDDAKASYWFLLGTSRHDVKQVRAEIENGRQVDNVVTTAGAQMFLFFTEPGERIERLHFEFDNRTQTCAVKWFVPVLDRCS